MSGSVSISNSQSTLTDENDERTLPLTDPQEPENVERQKSVLEQQGYTMGHQVGTGCYAKVKVAFSIEKQKLVAIKIMSKFKIPTKVFNKFIKREIDVIKGLNHSNVIKFYNTIETTHRIYIVMEYAENGSLLDRIRRNAHLDEDQSRNFFLQICDGVGYCHDNGIVHRDIKCENLLLDKNNNIKLIDFGFSRKIQSNALSDTFCGSYSYASPEILTGEPYQPKLSDIWAIGVVLFSMVFGKLPYDDSSYAKLLKQIKSKINFPRSPEVSTSCKHIIKKILSPLPQRIGLDGIKEHAWILRVPLMPDS